MYNWPDCLPKIGDENTLNRESGLQTVEIIRINIKKIIAQV